MFYFSFEFIDFCGIKFVYMFIVFLFFVNCPKCHLLKIGIFRYPEFLNLGVNVFHPLNLIVLLIGRFLILTVRFHFEDCPFSCDLLLMYFEKI